MGKVSSPLLSLGSHGTIADTLTYQQQRGQNIVKTKPTPTRSKTIQQAYQRWLYQDYLYQWSQLSQADRLPWRQEAARTHNTQVGAFMKDRLLSLPDILALYRFDIKAGSLTPDSSRYLNHATVYGPSLAKGFIGDCLYFDKSDDYVDLGNPAQYQDMSPFTFECLINMPTLATGESYQFIVAKTNWVNKGFGLGVMPDGTLVLYIHDPAPRYPTSLAGVIEANTTYHIALLIRTGLQRVYVNNILKLSSSWGYAIDNVTPIRLGDRGDGYGSFGGRMDNIILSNRLLDTTEIGIHSERRYP